MSARGAALDYAATRGWPVFPVSADGKKHPLIKAFAENATTNTVQLFGWWEKWPWALVAMPTGKPSGFVVLDVDVKNGNWGFDTLAELDTGLSILPETPMAHTLSGGLHVYFACHPAVEIRNSIGKGGLGPGLDIRGDGGLVVLPSPGAGYRWDPVCNFDTCSALPAPAWLGHRTRQSVKISGKARQFDAASVLEEACDNIRGAEEGDKWRTVRREAFIVGCLVRDRHVPESRARHELDAALLALQRRCANFAHAVDGYQSAFAEGLAAPRRIRA
jgi:hypothetical protein